MPVYPDGTKITSTEWDRLISSIVSTYTICKIGSTYYAENNVSGGSDDSDADFATLIDRIEDNDTVIYLKQGTYTVTTAGGLSPSALSNFAIIAPHGATIKQDMAGTTSIPYQLLSVEGACNNVLIRGITFDQDRDNHGDNTPSPGTQWIIRVIGSSKDVTFENCKFINGEQSGVVTHTVSHVKFDNCVFDTFGEHPFYLELTTHLTVTDCTILNWAKLFRGYGPKLIDSAHVVFENCYFEGDEDGNGYAAAGTYPSYGCYGPICHDVDHSVFENCWWVGTGAEVSAGFIEGDDTGCINLLFDKCVWLDMASLTFNNQNVETAPVELHNCFIDFNDDGVLSGLPTKAVGCTFMDQGSQIISDINDAQFLNCDWIRTTCTHDTFMFNIDHSHIIFDHNRFYNWTFRGFDMAGSTDCQITHCYFDGGVSSTWVTPGTRTQIDYNIWKDDNTHGAYVISTTSGTNATFRYNEWGGTLVVDIDPNGFDLDSIIVPFVDGNAADDRGYDIDAGGEYARAYAVIPDHVKFVEQIRIHAMSVDTEADGMELDITINAGQSNEAYNAETISVLSKGSETTNFAANDVIYWEIDSGDDADIDDLTAGDSLDIKVVHAAADGANCETDARLRTVQIRYI